MAGPARPGAANGLRFGVSVHASHAWMWMKVAQGADKSGPLAGSANWSRPTARENGGTVSTRRICMLKPTRQQPADTGKLWHWPTDIGASIPDVAYCERFYNRTADLINSIIRTVLITTTTLCLSIPLAMRACGWQPIFTTAT